MLKCIYFFSVMVLCSCINLYLDTYQKKQMARTGIAESTVETGGDRILEGFDCDEEPPIPFIVSIQLKRRHICVGTLVAIDWVLTAAHCGNGTALGLKCVIGKHKLSYSPQKDIDYSVIHPDYNRTTLKNDIQLLHLQVPVHNVIPAYFPLGFYDVDFSVVCKNVMVIGWGLKEENKYEFAEDLQCVWLKSITLRECENKHNRKLEGNLCTAAAKKGPILGDSGGPLMCGHVQYGFVSWGWSTEIDFPIVYTSINYHLEFILRTINYEDSPDIIEEFYQEISTIPPTLIPTRTTTRTTTRRRRTRTRTTNYHQISTTRRPLPVMPAVPSKANNFKIADLLLLILIYLS